MRDSAWAMATCLQKHRRVEWGFFLIKKVKKKKESKKYLICVTVNDLDTFKADNNDSTSCGFAILLSKICVHANKERTREIKKLRENRTKEKREGKWGPY